MAHLLAAQALLTRFSIPGIDTAVILGSGWAQAASGLGETLGGCELIDLPGFNNPVVPGHSGQLSILRTGAGKIAALISGRTHLYEGRGVDPVVHGVRTAAAAGAKNVILTNGCGSLVDDWGPGTVVLLRDHINLSGVTPLAGANFVDMSQAYAPGLRELAHQVDPTLPEGVYVQFHGPQYETPAEVRMAKIIGGDLVGMSTAVETIAAREAGLDVLGLSLVTNYGAGLTDKGLSHGDVVAAGLTAQPQLSALLAGLLSRL